jgi:hypothetical protein
MSQSVSPDPWGYSIQTDAGRLVTLTILRDGSPFWTYRAKQDVAPFASATLAFAEVLDLACGLARGFAVQMDAAGPTGPVAHLLTTIRNVTHDLIGML